MEEQRALAVIDNTALDPNVALKRKDVASALFESGLYPNVKNPAGAFAVVQYGAELGIGPMVSLQNINIISGKPTANGQTMLALAQSRGVSFKVLKETDQECTILFKKAGLEYESVFTMKDAEDAGLVGKDNWKKWKKDMLFWRAVAKGVRRIDPAAVMGLYTPDELTDGEIVDVTEIKFEQPKVETVEPEVLPPELTPEQQQFAREFDAALNIAKTEKWLDDWVKEHLEELKAHPNRAATKAKVAEKKKELRG